MTKTLAPAELHTLAVATDTQRAEIDDQYSRLLNRATALGNDVRSKAGATRRYLSRNRTAWSMTVSEAVTALQAKLAAGEIPAYDVAGAQRTLDGIAANHADQDANRAQADDLDQVWRDHGCWSRFFVVQGGHVHYDISADRCSRQLSTSHGWRPELSGLDEAAAVEALGPNLCTICFPTAPVAWTQGTKPNHCDGSKKLPVADSRWRVGMRHYGECTGCGDKGALLTSSGVVRAHKPAA